MLLAIVLFALGLGCGAALLAWLLIRELMPAPGEAPKREDTAMTAWLDRLNKYEREGFHEIAGPESNPQIVKWMNGPGRAKWVKSDAEPWCGGGLAGIFDECGLGSVIPDQPVSAISWLKCGVPCEPREGAIAVFPRTGGNHVTVIKRIRGAVWDCIGCNQSDAICTKEFRASECRGTRWPIPLVSPGEMTEESRIAAAAHRQQRDTVQAGGWGTTQTIPEPPPVPGWREAVTGWFDTGSMFHGFAEQAVSFTGFLAGNWRIVAGAIALFFIVRIFYDGHQIKKWRTADHNEGYQPPNSTMGAEATP